MKGRRPAELDDPDRKPRDSFPSSGLEDRIMGAIEDEQRQRSDEAAERFERCLEDLKARLDERRRKREARDQEILDRLRQADSQWKATDMTAGDPLSMESLERLRRRAELVCAVCHQLPHVCVCRSNQADGLPGDGGDEGWEG